MTTSNVLGVVVNQYKFVSLPEFNAVLRLYNVVAERGEKESRIYKAGGLNYRLLDDKGTPAGVFIKISLFHLKPHLKIGRKYQQRPQIWKCWKT